MNDLLAAMSDTPAVSNVHFSYKHSAVLKGPDIQAQYIIAPAEVSDTRAVFNAHFYYKQYLRSRHTSSGLYIVAPVALSNTWSLPIAQFFATLVAALISTPLNRSLGGWAGLPLYMLGSGEIG